MVRKRRHQRRIVLQRLAHAHHHDVGDDALVALQVLAQEVLGEPELGDDLAGGQVAAEALVAGGAEAAAHGAAGLRRNAQRAAVVLGNEHGLDRIAVADVEQPLDGAVGGFVLREDRQAPRRGRVVASFSRSDFARSVIWAKSRAPRWWIQRNSCVARKRFSPSRSQNAANPSRSKSSRLAVVIGQSLARLA